MSELTEVISAGENVVFSQVESKDVVEAKAESDVKEKTVVKASGVAYAGGEIQVGYSHPVVVDLSGMVLGENTPLLMNHENNVKALIGKVEPYIKDNQLFYNAEITSKTYDAENIVSQGKAGVVWQVSIGASVVKSNFIEEDEIREVNGRKFKGPFVHVLKSELREISVVAVGADKNSTMQITANLNLKGGIMPEIKQEVVQNEVKAESAPKEVVAEAKVDVLATERKRNADIIALCNGEHAEIEREAITAGWTVEETKTKILEKLRANRPEQSLTIINKEDKSMDVKALSTALALRAGVTEESLLKEVGEKTLEAADKCRSMSLQDVMIEAMAMEGKSPSRYGFGNDEIKAAFSTVSVPAILSNVAGKKMMQSFTAQNLIAPKLCSTGDLNDFKESERVRLTDVGDLLPIGADGEIKEGGVTEETAKNQIDTYAKKFCLTRKMIINDDLGAFLKIPTAMGTRAARLIDQLFFERLLSNPNGLFSTKNNNLLSGADSALGFESLAKAIQIFADQVDADGQPIAVEPRYLLVPTALKMKALELTKSSNIVIAGSEKTVRGAINVIADEDLQTVSSPYLANTAYKGASADAWYLFGDPSVIDTFEIGYYRGKRTPTIEQGDTDFNTLGMWFRVYFDVGVREQSHRGMVKANGK
jgi:phage head maturation protease